MTMTDNNQPGTNIGDPGGSGGGSSLADLRTRVGSVAGGFSSRQRVRMAMTFVGVAGGVLAFSFIGNQTDWAPLMSQLTPEDAAAVTKQLEAKGIEFQLTDGGTTVEV